VCVDLWQKIEASAGTARKSVFVLVSASPSKSSCDFSLPKPVKYADLEKVLKMANAFLERRASE
jgi:hypothetical protein